MNVQLNTVSATRKNLVVSLDAPEVDAEHRAVVLEYVRLARLPGFRPGKAPEALVIKRFSKEITEEFKNKVVTKAYRDGLEKEKVDVLNVVNVEEGAIEPGKAVSITVTLDVRPEFELPEYVGLPTKVPSPEPTDAEVDAFIDELRGQSADFKATDRPAQKGDYVKLSYEGTVDGRPASEVVGDKQLYAKVPQTWEEVEGANEGIIPGLGRQLAGVAKGGKKTVSIDFPADFAAVPPLGGKTVSYAIEVQEVREKVLPALDEAFCKSHRADNVEGLRSQVRSTIKLQKERANISAQRAQVTQALSERVLVEPPQSLVESETQSVLRQFIGENMRRGIPAEQFEKDKKELFESAKKAAAGRVKVQLILAKIAEKEKISVTEGDIDAYIRQEAMRSSQRADKIAKDLSKDREALRSVQQAIIFDKSVDFLVSKATVTTSES